MGGALEAGRASRLRLKGPKIHQQRPSPQPGLRRLQVPVQRAVGVQQPIQRVHRTVHRIARAVALRVAITQNILLGPTPELVQRLLNRARPHAGRAPLTKGRHRLAEGVGTGRLVHLPDLLMQLERLATPVADLQDPVQETQDQDHLREQRPPGALGCFPAVGVHRLRSVRGGHRDRLIAEPAVGGGEVHLARIGAHGHPQQATASGGHRDVRVPATQPGMMFVRGQVSRQGLRITHRGAHHTIAPQ
jgi:hypothetical protein